jgi:pyruvate dehydrogenase E1 component
MEGTPSKPDPRGRAEWAAAYDRVLSQGGRDNASRLLELVSNHGRLAGLEQPDCVQTPYVNTIPPEEEPPYPGDEKIEKRIRAIVRWNAAVMVHRANKRVEGIGGHLSTFASSATLYEVGLKHFFRGRDGGRPGDQVFIQGHAAPGIYAQAFLEGRLTEAQLDRFRREVGGGGLSSYPHPWLMPDFWEFPTVSMGLSPLTAIYQARFNRYLRDRGLKDTDGSRVWCFLGDGECDEPETLGALHVAAIEKLDNLVFVVNCNLQRLDGPVRGNGKIIQELEAGFLGSGWNVLKVIWGSDWDPLLAADEEGWLVRRMNEAVDGEYQKYSVEPGSYTREHFFGKYPKTLKLVQPLTDDQIRKLRRGGHDHRKVYAAYHRAVNRPNGRPTAILAKTVKGWALGEAAEGRNTAHQAKKLNEEQLRTFRDRLGLPIPDAQLHDPPYYLPPADSEEIRYLRERRRALGGSVPRRIFQVPREEAPPLQIFPDLLKGSEIPASTTTAYARLLALLLRDEKIGKRIVPIVSDEARTFGLDALFSQAGIYSSAGQRYDPVDSQFKLYYREAKNGQVIEEGITEAGALASFTCAGTSYATHGLSTIPFYAFYSMFGYQRVGDLVWAAADARARGFLIGATAGRTTINGEGLQHEDGHSPLLFSAVPTARVYDPAWAYELAVVVQDGLRRMLRDQEPGFTYITVYNEAYPQPPMPAGVEDGIVKGLYLYKAGGEGSPRVQILGSGSILREALRAQQLLAAKFGVAADVWSAPGWLELRRDALACERWNDLHPEAEPRVPYAVSKLGGTEGPIVAVSDWMRAVPEMIARWFPGRFSALGTDGFGRSDSRPNLRRHFEIDAEHVAWTALVRLAASGGFPKDGLAAAMKDLGIDPEHPDPATA